MWPGLILHKGYVGNWLQTTHMSLRVEECHKDVILVTLVGWMGLGGDVYSSTW